MSESAFTVQIRQLKDALGIILFDRGKRRIALTVAGQELRAPLNVCLLMRGRSLPGHAR